MRSLTSLLVLCAVWLWPSVVAHAQNNVRVNLVVTVKDDKDKPVSGALINLPRGGTNAQGEPIYPITNQGTDGEGHLERPSDFDLVANPLLEMTVTARDFLPEKVTISAEQLRQAAAADGRRLEIPVRLKPDNPPASQGSGNVVNSNASTGNTLRDGNTNSASAVTNERSYFQTLKDAVNYAIWWLGILLLALVAFSLLALRRGYRPSFRRHDAHHYTPNLPGDGRQADDKTQSAIAQHLVPINKVLTEISRKQNESYTLLDKVFLKVNQNASSDPRTPKKEREVTPVESKFGQANDSVTGQRQSASSHTTQQGEGNFQQFNASSPQAGAVKAYHKLLRGTTSAIDPVYLNAENKNSLTDMLEDGPVHLMEVGHTQGTFVLFASGDQSGWIFPNPVLTYREQALKPVFPSLTEGDFNSFKDRIEPIPARKVAEGRWKLEAS